MNRMSHCPAIGSLFALALTAAAAAGCAPDNSVEPGAPVLTKFIIVQPSYARTTIDATAIVCPARAVTGDPCLTGDDEATVDVVEVADGLCQQETTHDWCSCDAATDPMAPVWACGGFDNVRGIAAVFDRLLDPVPLAIGPVPAEGATDTVTASVSGAAPATTLVTDYASNGSPTGLLLPFFAYYYYMNFRLDGPSLLTAPEVAFPSGTTVTLTIDPTLVRGKDGTPFTGAGPLLMDGILTFNTSAFAAGAVSPDMVSPSMVPTMLTVAFNNVVNADDVAAHVTVTSSTTGAIPVTVANVDPSTIGITPAAAWPASATLTVVIDATTPNALGQPLGAAVTATVTTSAN